MTDIATPIIPANPNGKPMPFAYIAQTMDGRSMSGTVNAITLDEAAVQLHGMQLRVIEVHPAPTQTLPAKALASDDFLAFNDQLAHLTKAGLPIEQGLRLLAADLRRGRLASTVRAIANDLDRGLTLSQAIEVHRASFPPLYAKLIDAGIRSGDLGGVLLSMGRSVETMQKLRRAIWQASAYPLMVAFALAIVLALLSLFVFPAFETSYARMGYVERTTYPGLTNVYRTTYHRHGLPLPWLSSVLFQSAPFISIAIIAIIALMLVSPILLRVLRAGGFDPDQFSTRFPIVGRAVKLNLVTRWCETVRLAVSAGLDLPAALQLAGETTSSAALRRDSVELVAALDRGMALETADANEMLPTVVPPLLDLAARSSDLPAALATLSTMFQQQAQQRIGAVPAVLLPLLMIIVGLMIGFVLAGLLTPLLRLVNEVMRGPA